MSRFTVLWAYEAEEWIQDKKKLGEETGNPWSEDENIHIPSDEEKKGVESEISSLFNILTTFAKKILEIHRVFENEIYMKIWFNTLSVYVEFWYEPADSGVYFIIRDDRDIEWGRIIFEDIPSINYSDTYLD